MNMRKGSMLNQDKVDPGPRGPGAPRWVRIHRMGVHIRGPGTFCHVASWHCSAQGGFHNFWDSV